MHCGGMATFNMAASVRIFPCSRNAWRVRSSKRMQCRTMMVGPTDNIFSHRAQQQGDSSFNAGPSPKGALAAWTVSIKDNICTKDMPTTCSSAMLQGYTSPFDATVVQLLRNAGATIVGKTNCDEFGMGSTNVNSVYGPVVNPKCQQDREPRVAGGSSGGAAASVAGNLCRIAIGSDTGGSIRLPAAYCGVYGFKPSYGLLSRWGLVSYADSLDTIGIVALQSKDLKPTFDVLAHFDEKDPTSISTSVRRRADLFARKALERKGSRSGPLNGVRIGVPQELFAKEIHPRVLPALRQTLASFRSLGAEIAPVHLTSAKYALSAYYVLASAEASSNLARYDGVRYGQRANASEQGERDGFARHIAQTRSSMFGAEVQRRLLLGTYALTSDLFDNYFVQAQRVRQLVRQDLDKAFSIPNALLQGDEMTDDSKDREGVHALVHPSAVDIAPTLSEAQTNGAEKYTQDLLTVPASLAGLPSVSVPMGKADEMPVGVTLTTQWGCEAVLWRLLEHVGP